MDLTTLARDHAILNEKRRKALLSGNTVSAYKYLMNMYSNLLRVTSQGFTLDELFTEMDRLEAEES